MPPLNPFLRVFFRSALAAQCVPVHDYIILAPTTEFILTSRDHDTGAPYTDIVGTEEFLNSHVLRLPARAVPEDAKATGRIRDSRSKAKQFHTLNGRTVVIKEAFVYSNKGFKDLTQAQLLYDVLWYPDNPDMPPWLIYFISKPLFGSPETIPIPSSVVSSSLHGASNYRDSLEDAAQSSSKTKSSGEEIATFNDVLNGFPMIARQMQPDLERLFKNFSKAFEKPLPSRPLQQSPENALHSPKPTSNMTPETSRRSSASNGHIKPLTRVNMEEWEEGRIRQAVEEIVTAAIDLFQLVDKQQLSMLGATTNLTGPRVERLIERYVTEQLHDSIIFPAICAIKRFQDQRLEGRIRQMENLDISQVGIPIIGGMQGKHDLLLRLEKGVEEFRKLGVAGSPQEMIGILLCTQKTVATVYAHDEDGSSQDKDRDPEKLSPVMTINADTLVSLLLVVVIRSQVRHLHARLAYMRNFVFIENVEGGEMGYALSTFEAVLSYLESDSGSLRKASRKNKILWEATKNGRIEEMKSILDPEHKDEELQTASEPTASEESDNTASDAPISPITNGSIHTNIGGEDATIASANISASSSTSPVGSPEDPGAFPAAPRKRVSISLRSLSSSSGHSFHSRTTTIDSRGSGIEGDTSIDRLSSTQNPAGESIIMMAIENRQPEALKYLLSLSQYFPLETTLEDSNNTGTTLLSAAVQLGHTEIIDILLNFILQAKDDQLIAAYLGRQDNRGRTVAHHIFNAHHLIKTLGRLLPWRVKDKNGQTPLFALCRSYDHSNYRDMVWNALVAAREEQPDEEVLQLDDHVDSKGNTLLHIVNDTELARYLLHDCNSDINATNDKRFTPLMVASKYGRVDLVNVFLEDPRVDIYAKDFRGLTAVELAKDDEVRDRIDDMILLSIPPDTEGRRAAIVRSYFLEDATIRLVVKSAVPSSHTSLTITTSRRSLSDFENLAKWLSIEHPVSWLPIITGFRSPFQIPSRPSRAILRDIQSRLESFLKVLMAHPTFSNHEMVWEFLLMPEILPETTAERSRKKAAAQAERVKEEYEPVVDVHEVEAFAQHAKNEISGTASATKSVTRRVNRLRTLESDVSDAQRLTSNILSTLTFLEPGHMRSVQRLSTTLTPRDPSPLTLFHADLHCISSTITALLRTLSRPAQMIDSIAQTSRLVDRQLSSLRRSDRWPLGLLDDTRSKIHRDAADRVDRSSVELAGLKSHLRYTQQIVAGELAAWQDMHEKMGRRALRNLAQRMLVVERERLEGLRRAVRGVVG
ncbi:MAG: hypothetical protein M1816_007007 [Peltula sp. TS41687]|nr:MAG: hypothetical protein M1816_007007 [Peltula sp. TS41687]